MTSLRVTTIPRPHTRTRTRALPGIEWADSRNSWRQRQKMHYLAAQRARLAGVLPLSPRRSIQMNHTLPIHINALARTGEAIVGRGAASSNSQASQCPHALYESPTRPHSYRPHLVSMCACVCAVYVTHFLGLETSHSRRVRMTPAVAVPGQSPRRVESSVSTSLA